MSKINVEFFLDEDIEILKRRNLETGGLVQQYIDNEVISLSKPYIPHDTGALERSADGSEIGSGLITYEVNYAWVQYYRNKGNGLRGSRWTERMKADRFDEILDGAAKIAGGKAKND